MLTLKLELEDDRAEEASTEMIPGPGEPDPSRPKRVRKSTKHNNFEYS